MMGYMVKTARVIEVTQSVTMPVNDIVVVVVVVVSAVILPLPGNTDKTSPQEGIPDRR